MTRLGVLSVVLGLTGPLLGQPMILENQHVRVEIDPAGGGAVTRMVQKQAVTLPYTADRGAQVAGIGKFFIPVLAAAEAPVDLSAEKLTAKLDKTAEGQTLTLTGPLDKVAPGLTIERVILLGNDESGLRITDTYRNSGADLTLRVGAKSRQDGQPWNLTLRCWYGDTSYSPWRFTPYSAGDKGDVDKKTVQDKRVFWRMAGQYGVGILYQTQSPTAPVDLEHKLPKENGNPAEFSWLSAPTPLAKGAALTVSSGILIDEGGRSGGGAAQCATSGRMLLTLDLPAAGRNGVQQDCFATAVSAVPRKVKLVISEHRALADWNEKAPATQPAKIAEQDMALPAGLAQWHHFHVKPKGPGLYYVSLAVLDEAGKVLASTNSRSVIDGESLEGKGEFGATWKKFTQRLPEVQLKGSWEEMGKQLAEKDLTKPLVGLGSQAELAFYDKTFPYYAKLLRGAAQAKGASGKPTAAGQPDPEDNRIACMGLVMAGPDGPIHLYSKERGGSGNSGMGYVKVVPAEGYSYHMYTLGGWNFGYGVNSAGLATSGATINNDGKTDAAAKAYTKKFKDGGGRVAPIAMHMLLATCKTVDEAVKFIENPQAPLEFDGNLLVSDITGKAVVLNSVGTMHNIVPCDGKKLFATGNYPLQRQDGLFGIGDSWGWAANTMLREHMAGRFMKARNYAISLEDAFLLMASQWEPGNMDQTTFENVGLLWSTSSVIAVAKTGDLYISNGPPHLVEYVKYTLKE